MHTEDTMTHSKRWHALMTALTLTLVMMFSTGRAAADPPSGGCPGPYALLNRREAVRLVLHTSDLSRPEAHAFIDTIDKNEDNQVCAARTGNPHSFNYIDNQAHR